MGDADTAEAITRASGSNLAFAFGMLPAAKRRDMTIFYAFCRTVDDIADDEDRPVDERRDGLARWRRLVRGEATPSDPLAKAIRGVQDRYRVPAALLEEIIEGMEMDLAPRTYATLEELLAYCYRAASAVGLVSIEIFGYDDPACREYAVELGYALQLTNILRDVAEDAQRGRVYLPLDELERQGLAPADLLGGHPDPEGFLDVMTHVAQAAEERFARARARLPADHRSRMAAAETMRSIYHRILRMMERDGFRVYERRYRPLKITMLGALGRGWLLRHGL